jgi:hypothetical protein
MPGVGTATISAPVSRKAVVMATYMLVLHETPGFFSKLSPEEIQRVIEKYMEWGNRLGAAGKLKGGHKLKEEGGRHLTQKNNKLAVVDGPYSETKEVVGGYYLIEAADYNDAVKLVSDCPHLQYGRIEVREIDPME